MQWLQNTYTRGYYATNFMLYDNNCTVLHLLVGLLVHFSCCSRIMLIALDSMHWKKKSSSFTSSSISILSEYTSGMS